ncbi:MAG: type II secretion system protein [Zoogloeaceae bacterium]|nr:type II secretion system protein [Zoogloeaceae bacterium]
MTIRERGFSLVELGMVLVIIALLTGGILLGARSMIQRGEMADLVAKVQDLAAAARQFKGRYGYYPGDLPNAATYLTADGGVSPACSYALGGQIGNGMVDTTTESDCALEHLQRAGLLTKLDSLGGAYGISGPGGAPISLWHDAQSHTNAIRITGLACEMALELDLKLDAASAANTPLAAGQVRGLDAAGAPLSTCTTHSATDPVATLLIAY